MHRRLSPARTLLLAALALTAAVAALARLGDSPASGQRPARAALVEPLPIPPPEPLAEGRGPFVYVERFERGDSIGALAARLGLAEADARALARLPELRALRPGTALRAELEADGTLASLSFLGARERRVEVTRGADGGLLTAVSPLAPERREETRAGEIRSSLFAATDAAGIPDAVALQLADIFGGEIDFHRDLRRGDRFAVVYEVYAHEGRVLRAGRVLAAEFVHRGRALRALWFESGAGGGYYAPDGSNLRRAFLRSPLELSRVSSGFGLRAHPFLGTWRAHRGVDYAAPAGTRVRATADGTVEFAGRSGGYGNVVVLRHGGGIETLYAHLSGFARGIRKGARVAQGETIGYVGQTGWATAPHLHYEFRAGGIARDPLRVALPAAAPVPPHERAAFHAAAAPLVSRLELAAGIALARFE